MMPATSRAAAKAVAGSVLAVSTAMGFYTNIQPTSPSLFQRGGGGRSNGVVQSPASSSDPRMPSAPSLLSKDPDNVENAPTLSARHRHLRQQFQPGDYYVWLYRDKHGNPTSWEKYEVAAASPDGEEVCIEMSTKFAAADKYFVHHRMKVNLGDHLGAFRDRGDWRIGFEHCVSKAGGGAGGEWQPFGTGDNVQAFEEKFDVFSMLNMTNKYEGATRVVDLNENKLTLTRSGRHSYTEAWYAPSRHYLSGIAVLKKFAEHSFSLIRTKRGGQEVDVHVDF